MTRMRVAMLAMALPLAAGACATMAERPADVAGPCRITGELRMRYVGMRFEERMRHGIERAAQARVSRILRPDDAATMDFRPDRLTILLDDGGQIDSFRCG